MRAFDVVQALWLLLLLSSVAYVGRASTEPAAQTPAAAPEPAGPDANAIAWPLRDASGRALARKHYRHIASTSSYADELLLALAEPERITALSQQGHRTERDAFRYGARPLVSGPADLERLLALRVDLLLVNHLGAQADLARVREAGIAVFDLGEMRGLDALEHNILAVAALLGDPARGQRLWHSWSLELRSVARDIPSSQRKAAAYVAIYANKLYGGTRGTSYHDVLNAAGLRDAAAERFRDWPQYDPEQLLVMDPPLIVTEAGMGEQLCNHAWLRSLRACQPGESARNSGIVELSRNLMGSAGLGMLEAALELRERVYPTP